MNKEKLTKEFIKAVEEMKKQKEGVYYWRLPIDDDENDWAIVLGYSDGFDEKEQDEFTEGTWRLCAKLAYQPNNSMLQCDYNIDWLMPYNKSTNEVDDREESIYPSTNLVELIDWLWKWYEDYKNALYIDGDWHFINDLREGYRIITGLDNDDEMTDEEVKEYMREAMKEED